MDMWGAIGVVIATGALVVSWLEHRRAVKSERAADERAARTEAIAQRAAEAAHAAVAAQESMAAALRGPTWTLEHLAGDTYALTNTSSTTAYDVRLTSGDLGAVPARAGESLERGALEPGEPLRFMAALTFDVVDDSITVTWADEPDGAERHEWSRPLPPNG
jgi:hypothetical protein